jgi:RNA polymerase sigma factor (sigma-70 family)
MDGATRPPAQREESTHPQSRTPAHGRPVQAARVNELLAGWRARELRVALAFRECRGLSEDQLEDLYQETTLALLHRPYNDHRHLQRALRKGLKRRALNLHRDERRRQEILAENASGIHILEKARSAENTPEQVALLREDRLLVTEFLAELSELERRVCSLLIEGLKYHAIAKEEGITVNQARNATRSYERKRERFLRLYNAGRLCGYRSATIRALQNGQATSDELAMLAIAHVQACPHCRAEHKTNARRLRRDFQRQAAELLPPPLLLTRLGWLSRTGLRARALQQRVWPDGITLGTGGVRERAVALLAGSGASAKLAAGVVTAAVITGGAISATHEPTHHKPGRPHHAAVHAISQPRAYDALDVVQRRPAPAPAVITARRPRADKPSSRPGHVVVVTPPPRPPSRPVRLEPGGFAYLGVPTPRAPAVPVHAAMSTHDGGPFGP